MKQNSTRIVCTHRYYLSSHPIATVCLPLIAWDEHSAKRSDYLRASTFSKAHNLPQKGRPSERIPTTRRRVSNRYWESGSSNSSSIESCDAVTNGPPSRFCNKLGYDPRTFLKDAQVSDFKIFWRWTVDHYNKINVASSLRTYWRTLRMHALDVADRDFDPRERRDIRNVRY